MSVLLVLTTGQTDVQLVLGDQRQSLDDKMCADLHDEIERRTGEWRLVDPPVPKLESSAASLPPGIFALCTPKLDAVLKYVDDGGLTLSSALIFETRRDNQTEVGRPDPRFAGAILERRLREHGVSDVVRVAYLEGRERFEDRDSPRDAIIRRAVVEKIDRAVRECLGSRNPSRIVIATTGGIRVVNSLIEDIVRLYAPPGAHIDPVEVSDGTKADPPTSDRAVSRHWVPEPSASYRARRYALQLIGEGDLLGAWGAVRHLHDDDVERHWTQVVQWLYHFAASLPIPDECDIGLLKTRKMAVRTALRVEFALRAGDIPRAVHGTVAFFESALWDQLEPHLTRHGDPMRRLFKVEPAPDDQLVRRRGGSKDDRCRPFEVGDAVNGVHWYRIWDDDRCGRRLAEDYLRHQALAKLGKAVSPVRELRNDVAHNEPTPQLMEDAQHRMADAHLWSPDGKSFLAQPMVQDVLKDLGENEPARLCTDLIVAIRERLLRV
jgi:hypothetical protein